MTITGYDMKLATVKLERISKFTASTSRHSRCEVGGMRQARSHVSGEKAKKEEIRHGDEELHMRAKDKNGSRNKA